MLILRTGLPGASKTLNTLNEICSDSANSGRPIFYNNIKLLMLDFSVCESFAGYFYGVYLPALDDDKKRLYQKTLLRIHAENELASTNVFPHLEQRFDAWLESSGHIDLWLIWVRRCYPASRLTELEDYLKLADTYSFSELGRFCLDWRHFDTPTGWYLLERNSVIVIDECQQWFPPRPPGSKAPKHCSEFETHRHKGYDVHLITQDAKLLDSHVRRLTGRHVHYFNPFSSNRVTRYEADKVFDPEDYHSKQKTQSRIMKRSTAFYGVYWSADVHTHKFRLPKKALLIIPIIILLPLLVWVTLSGVLISSPELHVTDSSHGPIPVSSNRSSGSILPASALSAVHHPLSDTCERITYAARIRVNSPRRAQTQHLFQCENGTYRYVSHRDTSPDDETLSYQSQPPGDWDAWILEPSYLARLGYSVNYDDGFMTLSYGEMVFVFPGI